MLNEILDVIEVALFSDSPLISSMRTIGLALLLAWIIGRLVRRWFEEQPAGRGGGGGGGQQQKQQQLKSGGGGRGRGGQQLKGGSAGGGGGAASIKPGLLEGVLAGLGAGIGAALAGLGSGIGGVVRGIGGAIGEIGRGRSGGQHYLGGPQAHSPAGNTSRGRAWKGAAVGLGVGLGLGATAASWAKSQASAAAETARRAWQDWQTARHYSQAPAYSWTVPEDAAETIGETFAANGIPHRWEQTDDGLRVVILQEDVTAAANALDMAGLEFTELGTPAAIWPEEGTPGSGWIAPDETGELREWQPGDIPSEEGQPTDEPDPAGVAEVYDPETGTWSPVTEPEAWPDADRGGEIPSDTWGGTGGSIVLWGGE